MTSPSDPCTVKVSVRPGRGFFQTLARWWWLELLLLIALPCAFAALALAKHQQRGPSYESTALIEITPPADAARPEALKIELHTQCAILRSDPCLKRVVQDLDLARKWNVADSAAALAKLKPMVGAHPVDGTRLVRVTARAKDPATARDLADGLRHAYMQVRSEDAANAHQILTSELKRQIRIQEDAVEQARKVYAQIAKARGMVFGRVQADEPAPPVIESADYADYRDARRNYERETALLESLRQRLSEVGIAAKLEPPPAVVREEPALASGPVNHHPRREVAGAAFVGFVLAFIGMIPLALLLEGFSANRRLKKAATAPEPAAS
ncbi:MAG: hypothetical protein MUF04_08705 [Akkermansiaceae bacterium]|nr:hypothetical protein [Akkermansiaceae bacterium]